MIKVNIYKNSEGKSVGFKLKGHAGYDDIGKDIICAATSVLAINTINSIERFTDDDMSVVSDEKKALIEFRLYGNISPESRVLLDSLELGLSQIRKDNAEYISITFKEV